MANVAHSTLTGSNLHEPKGVSSASSGQVYIADGLGSGAWTSLGGAQNPFANSLMHLTDTVSSGTAAQTLISNSWNTRRLQTVNVNQISNASLNNNLITLPAGTYWMQGQANVYSASSTSFNSKLRFRNITDSSDVVVGDAFGSALAAGSLITTSMSLFGKFTIASTKIISLQHYLGGGGTVLGGGIIPDAGVNEVYANIMLWKL